jgi:hypothetical protein
MVKLCWMQEKREQRSFWAEFWNLLQSESMPSGRTHAKNGCPQFLILVFDLIKKKSVVVLSLYPWWYKQDDLLLLHPLRGRDWCYKRVVSLLGLSDVSSGVFQTAQHEFLMIFTNHSTLHTAELETLHYLSYITLLNIVQSFS